MKRQDIKGFTLNLGKVFLEIVYHKNIFNLKVIAFNFNGLTSKTYRLLDLI